MNDICTVGAESGKMFNEAEVSMVLHLRSTASLFLVAGFPGGCAPGQTQQTADAVSKVTREDVVSSNESIEHMLERKAPGLVVVSDGAGVILQIRGNTQIDGSPAQPLYILNDLPFTPGPNGLVSGIDIHDIDTVKVLKGAQAGLYGIEGANGVIVITTKTASRR